MAKPIIKLEDVTYYNQASKILNQISGDFYEEQITTFIGPSGAGKSTLFRLLNGLISPNKGSILLHGKDINLMDPIKLRRKVGIVLQEAIMLSGTVFDNLALPNTLQQQKFTKADAEHLLDVVGLEQEYLTKPARELSGGQKQKVSIARTLANEPDVLLLDEITSSLDQVSIQTIEKLIKAIKQEHQLTVLWITHDIDQATRVGDLTWVMMDGQILEKIESKRLNDSTNRRVQSFLRGESNK